MNCQGGSTDFVFINTAEGKCHRQVDYKCKSADGLQQKRRLLRHNAYSDQGVPTLQDDLEGLKAPEGAADDALLTEDDDLDRHPAMLPAVQLVERAAVLWAEANASRQGGHCRVASCRRVCLLQHPVKTDRT